MSTSITLLIRQLLCICRREGERERPEYNGGEEEEKKCQIRVKNIQSEGNE
jgi:hypothetical protein